MVRVLFVASEGVPFVKTGGLADVIGSLPKELRKQGLDVRVMLPKYGDIPIHLKEKMVSIKKITIPVGWRQQYCGIEALNQEGVPFYFIDNEYYFKRPGLYGFYDEAERFAFFCRAVLESLPHLDFAPQIIHCHDWHTGMVSVLLKAHYKNHPFYQGIRTMFTIHNLQYQGVFPRSILGDLLNLGEEYFTIDGVEFYGQVSFMKGGLNFSDLLTTVSETYAREIQDPYYGERLDGLLRYRQKDLHGILNGIDYELYNPANDPLICAPYDWQSLNGKQVNKEKLQRILCLPPRQDVPVIAIVSRLVSQKGLDLVAHVLEEIMNMDVQLVVLGAGEKKYEQLFKDFALRYPDKLSTNLYFGNTLAHRIYAGADILLMPSRFEPCGLGQIIALRYGCLPLVRETGGLKDTILPYNRYTGAGNGFSFTNYNAHELLFTLQRAVELYQQPEIWFKLVVNAMQSDFSWYKSAQKYKDLYNRLNEM
ncbi:glycogen synthase GlgA [Desulfotomaculum nigrificans]|uniref:glycogen synthase GlgA n=1 Tax=Desulfotomaculum nigrificans TaxID=1565 RepID=UPI0001FADF58|nr:glycogen synthase GlgA [Desulfotomaculum nigrificans]